jgi:hypothetical protein
VCGLEPSLADVRVERVGKARGHVWNHAEFAFKVRSKLGAGEVAGHPVAGERVGPNTTLSALRFVVVDEKFGHSVPIEVGVGDGVGRMDLGFVDDAVVNELAGFGRHAVEAHSLVERFSGKDDNFILELFNLLYVNPGVRSRAQDVLGPVVADAFLGVFEPDELTLFLLVIAARSDEILAAVAIEVDPFTHLVMKALSFNRDLVSAHSLSDVFVIHEDNMNATISLKGAY